MSSEPPSVVLVPFTSTLLPSVQPWFEHPEVRRRLGGPAWPERELRLVLGSSGEEFRGRVVLRSHSWVALDGEGCPVGKAGGDVYDRWTRWEPSPHRADPVVTAAEAGPAMGLAYVVDPARWGHGLGRAMLRAVLEHPAVADVRLFAAGIDVDNEASRRCAAAVGFAPDVAEPDWEDTVYHLLRRAPATSTSPAPPAGGGADDG